MKSPSSSRTLANMGSLVAIAFLLSLSPSLVAGTHVWTGGSINENWSSAANWSGGAPTANEAAPVILEFPAGFPGPFTNNIANLKVDTIRLLGSGQVLRGVGGVTMTLRGGNVVTNLYSAGINYFDASLPAILEGTNRIVAPTQFTFLNALSGTGGLHIEGNVWMSGGVVNTFSGPTIVRSGAVTLNRFLDLLSGPVDLNSVHGPLIIEEGAVRHNRGNQIADDSPVRVEVGGVLDLNGKNDTVASLVMTGGEVQTDAGILTVDGPISAQAFGATINGRLSLGGSTRTFDVDSLATLVVNAVIINGTGLSNPGLAKTGNGTLRLNGANTFTGTTMVLDGALEIGHSSALGGSLFFGTSVAAGALVRLLDGVTVPAESLTLNGGSLYAQGVATWSGAVLLNTNSHLRALFAGNELRMLGPISGPGGFTHAGSGRLTLGGTNANSFLGDVTITEGDLWLAKQNNQTAVPGNLLVGHPANTNNENTVWLEEPHQIADSAIVTLLHSGVLVLDGVNDTIGGLVLDGGEVQTGLGTLTLAGNVIVQPSTDLARITGRLSLAGALRTFEIQASPLIPALEIPAVITGTGASGIRKTGEGLLWLSGNNTYSGRTVVAEGELVIDHPHALGEATPLASGSTIVEAGATLNTVLPASTVLERLELWGQGAATNGAWIVQGGALNWGGQIYLGDTARINVGTGRTLTLTNVVTGPGAFRKVGGGLLTFGGTVLNTFLGEARVDEGRVHCAKLDGFTSIPSGLYIGNSPGSPEAVVQLFADKQINDEGSGVMINNSGILDLNGHDEDIRSLWGSGDLRLGAGELRVFRGSFSGVISGTGRLRKISSDRFSVFANNTYTGDTTVEAGSFYVFSSLASANVLLHPGTELGGDGSLQNTILNNARLAPGLFEAFDIFAMNFANLTLSNSAVFTAEIRGITPGSTYDQLNVTGTVRLNNAVLDLKMGYPGAANTAYLLINNSANDSVVGTFNGKPEGATFNVAGAQFQITYQGGDGNDVVVTQLTTATNNYEVRLAIASVPGTNQVVVSWPTFLSTHNLFRCTNLVTGGWSQVFGAKVTANDHFHQTFSATNDVLLFRLEKQAF